MSNRFKLASGVCEVQADGFLYLDDAHLMLTGDLSAHTCGLFVFVPNDSCGHTALPPDYVTFLCLTNISRQLQAC